MKLFFYLVFFLLFPPKKLITKAFLFVGISFAQISSPLSWIRMP